MSQGRTLINILGAGRSGTTMLDLMLGNDSESFSLGEAHAWFRPFRRHHFKVDCNCGNDNCKYWTRINKGADYEFHHNAFDSFDVDFLIDSSKNLPWVLDTHKWAKLNDFRIVNFIIYKSPIDYIHSIWKRGESIEAAVKRYKLYYKRFFRTGLRAYSINYNELIRSPEPTLKTITKITGQPEVKDRHFFWEKQHHHMFGSGGIRTQIRKGYSSLRMVEYSTEFKGLIPKIKEKINGDQELLIIVESLGNIDYKNFKTSHDQPVKHKQPLWYYYLKSKNKFYSIFPKPSNTSQ